VVEPITTSEQQVTLARWEQVTREFRESPGSVSPSEWQRRSNAYEETFQSYRIQQLLAVVRAAMQIRQDLAKSLYCGRTPENAGIPAALDELFTPLFEGGDR
jgi:RNA polymerase-interacting CarD/CdnL/TRCF family regulator